MSWTDERIALLKKMWKEGKSAAEIAKMLAKGVTRNAVIGKAHRMGLSGRPSPIKKPATAKKEPAAKKERAAPAAPAAPPARGKKAASVTPPAANAKTSAQLNKEVEELKTIQKDIVPPGGGVALIDLTERMCKWPIGDPREPDFTFCGRGIRVGTPYCPDHAAMAYQTSSRSRGTALNAAARQKAAAASEAEEVDDVEVEVDTDDAVEDDEDVAVVD
ncbi:MAG: GcrA family cell cycle regulator [Alphaproteobacteria bacterium]|nr:GcrA family cell cycle regulator [Alphaproteobacteria bacterium]